MAKSRGSVRIGPISLFVLIIVVCLAVMAVLAVSTVHAQQETTNQQMETTQATYANEAAAQTFVAQLDEHLKTVRAQGGGKQAVHDAVAEWIVTISPQNEDGSTEEIVLDGNNLQATFGQPGGRLLTIELILNNDATYTITAWQATTQWEDPNASLRLWTNNKEG